MLRTFGNLLALRVKETDINIRNLTATRRLIKSVENNLLKGINISGNVYEKRYNLYDISLLETLSFMDHNFRHLNDLDINYQVFSGLGKERHYFDFTQGSYVTMPANDSPAVVVSPVDVTIDYLIRTE